MAREESGGTHKKRNPKKGWNSFQGEGEQTKLEGIDSLAGNEAVSDPDPFGFLNGSIEGGFLSLEELGESEYEVFGNDISGFSGLKNKVKGSHCDKDVPCLIKAGGEENTVNNNNNKKKIKNKKKKMKKKMKKKLKGPETARKVENEKLDLENAEENGKEISDKCKTGNAVDEESILNESKFYAWTDLRLHPLLMKSIYRLGFKEPTPIQKACIPAAAHQGKDVIGAAETGSGKTLAFGLPILQRLLEEQEKVSGTLEEGNLNEVVQGGPLRALIITPTRELALQVVDHLKEAAKFTSIKVVSIVGGMSTEKQERLLKRRPEIIVGTPGRLWELMSCGEQHLVELHLLSFFVLDEADRMVENGHFHELQSIIDLLPTNSDFGGCPNVSENCNTVVNLQLKKRQTCVFSATIALSENFHKKLKHRVSKVKSGAGNGLSSIETLSERAGIKQNVAIFDLTKTSIVAENLQESFIECTEETKEAYLYYILSVHGQGRMIVFCTSIAALRRIVSLLHILGVNALTLHAQMQQRARLKAIDRFRGNEHAILIATDVAARGLDIYGVRTVIHFQLPHSADVYVHRSGRTARASADGCCIALISPNDKAKFISLCRYLSKEKILQFPLNEAYLPEILKRISLARQIDKMSRKNSEENIKNSWVERNAESMEILIDASDSEEEIVRNRRQKKIGTLQLQKLQQELKMHLAKPLQRKQFSHCFFAGSGVSPLLHKQLEELSRQKRGAKSLMNEKRQNLVVIGQDCVEPLQALLASGHEVILSTEKKTEIRNAADKWKRKRKEEKNHEREQRRKKRKSDKSSK